jgi:hypothetical protein
MPLHQYGACAMVLMCPNRIGNKAPPSHDSSDSRTGKLMEKAGGLFKNEGMISKGQAKRQEAAAAAAE